MKVNGNAVGLQTNAWHCINCNFRPQDAAVTASGFAFDARILDGYWNEFTHRSGHQNLAEVLIYDRVLDDDERAAVEVYLAAKWGFTQKGTEVAADVDLAAGATLESCTIADGQTVELKNIPADPVGRTVKILSAAAFEGNEFLRSAVFTGEVPDPKSVRTRLRIVGNDLVVTFKPKGMLLLVR